MDFLPRLSSVQNVLLCLPLPIQFVIGFVLLIVFTLVFTRAYTTLRYRLALTKYLSSTSETQTRIPLNPPPIPYSIPFLGNALSFLAPQPGLFWRNLFGYHPSSAGACTLLLGGQVTHILHNGASVQALFKSRGTSRESFNLQIVRRSLGLRENDIRLQHGLDGRGNRKHYKEEELDPLHMQDKINTDTLLKTEAVNELMTEFTKFFKMQMQDQSDIEEIGLYKWLQAEMFKASGRVFMGEKLVKYYPTYSTDFWKFDSTMLSLFFGIPEIFLPTAVKNREDAIKGMMRWHEGMEKEGVELVDAEGSVAWEPNWGSRANRARQKMYRDWGLSIRGRAGLDVGFTFGLASNAIPATGWMLMHILNPNAEKTLLPRVLKELETALLPDGGLDLATLISLPLLQSIFHEVLRLYTDVLVTRELHQSLNLPMDDGRILGLSKGTVVIAPSWVSQRNPATWTEPPATTFCPERFLTTHPNTGKDMFTLQGTGGKFFPFGGGKSICPGRVFAKQEVLAATALALLEFEFDVKGFIDKKGKGTEQFPKLKDGFGGSGIVAHCGDILVGLKRRSRKVSHGTARGYL